MGALGVAANELFMYPYWILEKGYAEKLGDPSDPRWASRARHWINTIRLDAGLATIVATVVTAAFYLLGAAVLFRQHVMPQGLGVVEQISSVYTATYGEWSRWVFYVGCVLHAVFDARGLRCSERADVDRHVLQPRLARSRRIRKARDAGIRSCRSCGSPDCGERSW